MAFHGNYVQVGVESGGADTVKDSVDAMAASNILDASNDVLIFGIDRPSGAVFLCQFALLVGASSTDDLCTYTLEHLDEKKTHATGRSVNEGPLTCLNIGRLADQTPSCETLQENGSSLLCGDAVGNHNNVLGRHDRVLGVRAASHVDDLGADGGDAGRSRALCGHHLASSFAANGKRQVGFVETRAKVCVNKVDAGKVIAHENLAILQLRHRHVPVLENIWSARLVDLDGLHGRWDGCHCGRREAAMMVMIEFLPGRRRKYARSKGAGEAAIP